jgi:hypothetical protein
MTWVSQRDKGQSDAINQGLRRATGDIVSYLNSDDLYCSGAFERVAREFATHPKADFIYGDGDVVDKSGGLLWEWLSRPYNHAVMTSYHFLWNDFTNYIMQQATFWRRTVLEKIGYFDETFHYAMDVEYWIRAGSAGLHLRHLPQKLGQFRMNQGNKSLSSPTVFWEDFLEIYRRYRGNRRLCLFFAYYYFNLARQFSFDTEQVIAKGRQVFKRWDVLPKGEQQVLRQQADRGFTLACFLIANELHRRGQYERAVESFRYAFLQHPFLMMHPFGLGYLLRRVIGPRHIALLDEWGQRLIVAYRRRRYQYRYYQHGA